MILFVWLRCLQITAKKGEAAMLSAWEGTGLQLQAFLPAVRPSACWVLMLPAIPLPKPLSRGPLAAFQSVPHTAVTVPWLKTLSGLRFDLSSEAGLT